MNILSGIIKLVVIAAIIFGGYYYYTNYYSNDNKVEQDGYEYQDASLDEPVESPQSLIGKKMKTDEGLKVEFIDENTCSVENTLDSKRYTVKGTPKYTYKKIEYLRGELTIEYTATREEQNTLYENSYSYHFDLVFTNPGKGNAEMELNASQKETYENIVKSVPYDKKSSITFKLK